MKNFFLPTPVELAFEPINLCNARCYCCPYTFLEKDKEYRGKRMSSNNITFLIKDYADNLEKFKIPKWKCTVQPWRYSDPLVCKDLELIFELCKEHHLKVNITTNAVSFNETKCKLMTKYIDTLDHIYISIIGFNRKEIKEFMDIDWNVTQSRLKMIKKDFPGLSKKMIIGVKHKEQNPNPNIHLDTVLKIKNLTLGKVKKKKNWIANRLSYNKIENDGFDYSISPSSFVQGCMMNVGKILRRLEIMVDGTAVLCCDDATMQTNFGNVFDIGVSGVWKNLTEYHKLIYSPTFNEKKINLMCNDCSRASFSWDSEWDQQILDINKKFI